MADERLIDANALDSKLEALAKKYAAQGRFEAAKDYSFVQTVLLSAPTVDAVPVADIEAWLYQIAMNNTDNALCGACEEIISRLGGLRQFSKERAV